MASPIVRTLWTRGPSADHPSRVIWAVGSARSVAFRSGGPRRPGGGGAYLSNRITWLGHATTLVELGGATVLTDPLLRGRVAHLRRHAPRARQPERLDAVLISHLHRDHADGPSLRRLPEGVPVI